ncbi:MAG: glycosyltransferase family 4 protein [Chloroflexota bacterium]|nr:glycosyltransferase family 4 protein [Chloroflexota bacterium]
MRVLFTKRTFAPMGGSESLAFQFATRLAARGHDVRVVCGQAFDERPRFSTNGVDVVQVKPRGGLLGMVADASTLVDLMRVDELERYAEDRDLIHNVGREYLDSSLDVAEELDLPIVLTPLAHPGQFHGGDTRSDFERYRRATAITTMTDWERDWYASHGIDPYRVVTTGMGPNATRSHDGAGFRARHKIPADAPIVLYIGRRERYKGFIHLLDAAELVWTRHPETRFVFIGVPGFYGAVIDEFARYADDRIIELERASNLEKSAALDACSLYAMPSLHETFGIGYLEAWLHEKPVIGGDIPPLREVIAHGTDGIVVQQKVEDIAGAVAALLDDADLRARMGKAGAAKLAERWDWDRVMDRVEEAYAHALSSHVPAGEALA